MIFIEKHGFFTFSPFFHFFPDPVIYRSLCRFTLLLVSYFGPFLDPFLDPFFDRFWPNRGIFTPFLTGFGPFLGPILDPFWIHMCTQLTPNLFRRGQIPAQPPPKNRTFREFYGFLTVFYRFRQKSTYFDSCFYCFCGSPPSNDPF